MQALRGRVAVVTGGASGIGRARVREGLEGILANRTPTPGTASI